MHIILFNTKGGTAKSTLCEYISKELQRLNHSINVDNTDQQKHVSIIDNDDADFYLYDTAGAFTTDNVDLLEASASEKSLVLIPIGTGKNDFLELDFLIDNLEKCGVLDKSKFVFTKARANSKSLKSKRDLLKSKGLNVCKYVMPTLEDFSEQRYTTRTTNEISQLLHEIIL